MWRLFYPLGYLRLQNPHKARIDIISAGFLGVVIACPFILLPGANFFSGGGFLDKLLGLTSALTGFYVAALVAAATFTHPDLDKTITAGPIALITKGANGNRISELLTRREFVCSMFGYLAFSAMILSLAASIAIGISPINKTLALQWPIFGFLFEPKIFWYSRASVVLMFCLLTAHLTVTTSLGLYYLMDRLYRRDRQVVTPKPKTEAA